MSDPAPLGADADRGAIGRHNPGTLLGNRFRIKEYIRRDGEIELYRVSDAQSGADVALRVVVLPSGPALAVLERDLARAQRLPPHRNLSAVVGVVREGQHLLVAYEWQDGHTLRDVIDAHRLKGEVVDPTRAHTLLGHVAAGLSHAHTALVHGGVNPEAIWLTAGGRVMVGDLGLSAGLPTFAARGGPRGSASGLYFAPELARGAPATPASDVYSLGAILCELLTGTPPSAPLQPPSRVRPGIPPAVDGVVGRALMPAALTRFPTPEGLLAAFASAIGSPAVAASTAQPVGGAPAGGAAGKTFDVAAAAGLSQGEARWLLQKDRLDYGPFSLEQVKHQIAQGQFKADNLIVDMDSGARQKIIDHPQLGDFARQAERRLEQVRRARAEQATQTVERKKYRATVVVISAAVVVLGGGLTLFLMNREAAQEAELASRVGESDVDAFLKGVKVEFPSNQRPAARRAARPGGGGSKDDPFSAATNLGDVSQGGPDEILSDRTIQSVMMGNYRKLVPCLMDEKRRSPGLKEMDLEFLVLGSGKVSAVKVNGQRQGAFPGCVLARMQSFNFPKFSGSRTIASWSMSLK